MSIELAIIQHLALTKDAVLLKQLEEGWFQDPNLRYIAKLWKEKPNYLDKSSFESHVKRMDLTTKIETEKIFSKPRYNYKKALDTIQDDYRTRLLLGNLKELNDRTKTMSADEIVLSINKIIQDLPVYKTEQRKLFDGMEQENELLFNLASPRRPALARMVTEYKNLMVIGGHSKHQKTNVLIDTLDGALEANLKDPTFRVALFSKEMDFEELRDRLLAAKMKVPFQKIVKRTVDIRGLREQFMEKFPRWEKDFIILSPESWKGGAGIAKFLIQHKPKVWGLDYLQLAADEDPSENTNQGLRKLITDCKVLVRTTQTFGIPLSQLKDKDPNERIHFPRMQQLEWSKLVGQLAHYIGLCFWPYKIFPKDCDIRWFCIHWAKFRKGNEFNEILHSLPEINSFKHSEHLLKGDEYQGYKEL